MKKNFLVMMMIRMLILALDKRIVKRYQYAGDVWTYLKEFYEEKDQMIMMKGLKRFMTWKKNPKHSIKQVSQEIHYLAKRISELGGKPQDEVTIQVLFLAGLPKEFNNTYQILEL